MKYLDLEHRIIRYLAKIELNKNDATYMNNPHLKKCFVGDDLDLERVKQHFADRGILAKCNATKQDFDNIIAKLRAENYIAGSKALTKAINKHQEIEADRKVIMGDNFEERLQRGQISPKTLNLLRNKEY